jgi:hypothetical protein
MSNYTKIPPQERMLIIAKLYHNCWYSGDRFDLVMKLLKEWEANPVKEAKFASEILDGTELTIKNK